MFKEVFSSKARTANPKDQRTLQDDEVINCKKKKRHIIPSCRGKEDQHKGQPGLKKKIQTNLLDIKHSKYFTFT